jgi:UDP-N-acetylmuramyl pentapeptide phosphotransferase/UDP-N-acetylglucosamine-1-phosphate transferase
MLAVAVAVPLVILLAIRLVLGDLAAVELVEHITMEYPQVMGLLILAAVVVVLGGQEEFLELTAVLG